MRRELIDCKAAHHHQVLHNLVVLMFTLVTNFENVRKCET